MHKPTEMRDPITIFLDADALPRDANYTARTLAANYGANVLEVRSIAHYSPERTDVIYVDASSQAADMEIVKRLSGIERAIVVTGDYGLATMALSMRARVLSATGMVYSTENIDLLLEEREAHAKLRRRGGRHHGPKPRTAQDAIRFTEVLERTISVLGSEA